eukprot:1157293-Pelagomonas_calceolata.AAC.4
MARVNHDNKEQPQVTAIGCILCLAASNFFCRHCFCTKRAFQIGFICVCDCGVPGASIMSCIWSCLNAHPLHTIAVAYNCCCCLKAAPAPTPELDDDLDMGTTSSLATRAYGPARTGTQLTGSGSVGPGS